MKYLLYLFSVQSAYSVFRQPALSLPTLSLLILPSKLQLQLFVCLLITTYQFNNLSNQYLTVGCCAIMRYIHTRQCRPLSELAIRMKILTSGFCLLCLCWLLSLSSAEAGAVSVNCEAEYGAMVERLRILPAPDVFSFMSVNIGDRFRFQAQYLEDRSKLKTYVYELRSHAPTLIHAGEHSLSAQNCAARSEGFGLNKVYSSDLEREMFFQCFAICE